MLGDGQSVNLYKLFLVVREKGGYDNVCQNGLWGLVAEESGLGLNVASSAKLVHEKYLDTLESFLVRVGEGKDSCSKSSDICADLNGFLLDLGSELKGFLPKTMKTSGDYPRCETISKLNFSDYGSIRKGDVNVVSKPDANKKCTVKDEYIHMDSMKNAVEDEKKSVTETFDVEKTHFKIETELDNEDNSLVMECDEGKKCTGKVVDDVVMPDSCGVKEERSRRKRKRESSWGMLKWVNKVAENPCDPVIGVLPECSKWKSYSNTESWKQILSFREAAFLKRLGTSVPEKSFSQKNQKMHPCMYEDTTESSYSFRDRSICTKKNLVTVKSTSSSHNGSSSDSGKKENADTSEPFTGSVFDYDNDKKIPVGPTFQAIVPEWTGVDSESDSKWLGSKVWPVVVNHNRFLIERDPIGKGRQDSCGCETPGSVKCIRFHIAERRLRVKRELGSVFQLWKFDQMGEDVSLSWTDSEQKKFSTIVKLNPPLTNFWEQIYKVFRSKTRETLVCYYYNVFLLQRRALQNRTTPDKINSDDESETESNDANNGEEKKSSNSIFCSPKKTPKRKR